MNKQEEFNKAFDLEFTKLLALTDAELLALIDDELSTLPRYSELENAFAMLDEMGELLEDIYYEDLISQCVVQVRPNEELTWQKENEHHESLPVCISDSVISPVGDNWIVAGKNGWSETNLCSTAFPLLDESQKEAESEVTIIWARAA